MGANKERYRNAEQRLFADAGIEPTEQWVDLPSRGVAARVLTVGEGAPTVFLHQGYHAAAAWSYVAAAVPGIQCLLVDYPGCGLSEPLRTFPKSQEAPVFFGQLPLDVLDGLALDRANLVGASVGGYMALRAALTDPDRINRLVLAGCPPMVPGYSAPPMLNLLHAPLVGRLLLAAPASPKSVRGNLVQWGHRQSLREQSIPSALLDWSLALFADTDTLRNRAALYRRLCDWRGRIDRGFDLDADELAAVQVPCAIVAGTADVVGGPEVVRHLADRLPSSTLDLIPDAGHFTWYGDPTRVAARISEFVGSDTRPRTEEGM